MSIRATIRIMSDSRLSRMSAMLPRYTRNSSFIAGVVLDAPSASGAGDQAASTYQSFPWPSKVIWLVSTNQMDLEMNWNQSNREEGHRVSGWICCGQADFARISPCCKTKIKLGIVGDKEWVTLIPRKRLTRALLLNFKGLCWQFKNLLIMDNFTAILFDIIEFPQIS